MEEDQKFMTTLKTKTSLPLIIGLLLYKNEPDFTGDVQNSMSHGQRIEHRHEAKLNENFTFKGIF
jgi:hypothetical protein